MTDLTMVFNAILTLIVALVVTFLIPYLKKNVSGKELEEIIKWVRIAVQAAEMIFAESGMGKKKKEYVLDFLEAHGVTYDAEQLDALIESAVLELKKEFE